MCGLEAAEELVQGMEHLLRETLGDFVLVLAAAFEQGGEPLVAGQCQQPLFGQQQTERRAERAPGGVDQVREAEVHPAGALASRGGDQAQGNAVEQHPGGDPGAAQQALRTPLGRCLQSAGAGRRLVEFLAGGEHLHQQLPRRRAVLRIPLANREVCAQRLSVVRENDRQIVRDGSFFRTHVALGRIGPAENRAREFAKVSHERLGIVPRKDDPLVDTPGKQRLPLRILTVQDRTRLDQCRCRDHQSVRLYETQPFEVGTCVRIRRRHMSADFGSGAERLRVEQRSMFSREATIRTGREDSSGGTRDHGRIHEVALQTRVIRVQQARATDQSERYDVLVVGLQCSTLDEFGLALANPSTADLTDPSSHSARFQQPACEVAIAHQFFQHSATDDKLSAAIVQPVPEPCSGCGPLSPEYFERDARIDNGAHQ